VPPNVFFEVDDSGSMDWEVMTKSHWHYCAYDRDAPGDTGNSDCGYELLGGLSSTSTVTSDYKQWWNEVHQIFNDSDSLYQPWNTCKSVLESCTDGNQVYDWRLFSSDLNVLYYNPNVEYLPWRGSGFSNADFLNVRSDPQVNSDGYNVRRNLKNGLIKGSANTGFIYEVWQDSHGFTGSRPNRGTNEDRTTGSNGLVDLWDNHMRYIVKDSSIITEQISFSLNATTGALTENKVTTTYTGSDTLNGKTIAENQQNIANWYQYYRRRSFVAKAALGDVITANPENRYGLNFINNNSFPYDGGTSSFIEVPTGTSGFSSHNSLLLDGLYNLDWGEDSTPLRQGLERVGKYFDNNSSNDPIQYECQQNFSVLLTDGYWNGGAPSNTIGNADGDGYSISVADVARYYYKKDLSTKTDVVPKNKSDSATYQHLVTFTVAFGVDGLLTDTDNNGWPENPSTVSGAPPNLPEDEDWGDPFKTDSPEKIDDLWHAAYNSKGIFVSAATPKEVSDSLIKAIGSVGDRLGSASAASFNTVSLSSSTDLFLGLFNKKGNDWSGDLVSYNLDPTTGNIETQDDPTDTNVPPRQIPKPNWNAAAELDNEVTPASSRTIITYDKTLVVDSNTGNGIAFQWANLTTSQKNDLRTEPNGTLTSDDTKAEARLDYLRGDQSNEISNNGSYSFRDRLSLLGDIIHSAPYFVKLPGHSWPSASPFPSSSGNNYSDFKTAQSSRNGVVYVGANDGMLHGFSETTGEEVLAYIPSYLLSSSSANEGLHFLTDVDYQHRYYVDQGAVVSDVYIDKGDGSTDWHTVLIGSNRSGGRGIFALDITDPSQFNESNAADIALWEFSDADDSDLGLTFSEPTIAMMNNGRWAAIFGNGYNNKGDGKAKLFIVFLDGGVDGVWTDGSSSSSLDYIEIDTDVGSIVSSDCLNASSDCNGLSTPHAVDLDGDSIVDRVYAGDIQGNLWAFDVEKKNANNWGVAYKDGSTPKPLFIASSNQPIMDKPVIVKHPKIKDKNSPSNLPNTLVFFGTGQYLTPSDINSVPATQSFYGVWDHGTKEIGPGDLFEQRFDTTTNFENADGDDVTGSIRVFEEYDDNSDGTIDTIDYGTHHGWKINFNISGISGERVIVDPTVHAGLVFFNTWVPDTTPCKSGGSGFLMSVEQFNGGAPDTEDPAFDLNGDGAIDSSDLVKDSGGNTHAPVGEKFKLGLAASSRIIGNDNISKQFTPGSDGGIHDRVVRTPAGSGSGSSGRISWQELR
jgi:type IV pilus assembly protein PilY1